MPTLKTIRQYLPAAVILVGVLVAWEVLVGAAGVQGFVLPRPSAIWTALVENWTADYAILPAARVTLFEALGGLAIGTLLGVTAAFVVSRFPRRATPCCRWRSRSTPSPSSPSPRSPTTGSAITEPAARRWRWPAALVFFPIMINVLRGLTQVERSALELMRSYAAEPGGGHPQLRMPNALPYFLTGLKIATTLSLIGAVVGEYFGGLSANAGPRGGRRPPARCASTSPGPRSSSSP